MVPPPPPTSTRRSKRLSNKDEDEDDDDVVVDSKEVSMTIDDSNKLRDKLGLRKLDINNDNNAPEGSSEKPKLLYDMNNEDDYNAKDAIRKRRDKRIHDTLISGETLGHNKEGNSSSTVSEWIQKSRKEQDGVNDNREREEEEQQALAKKSRKRKLDDNIKMKVAHNVEDLKEGDYGGVERQGAEGRGERGIIGFSNSQPIGDTILTMKDKPILACGTDDEDDDIVLEEVGGAHSLAQKDKEDLWKKEKERKSWDPAAHWDNDDNDGILDKYTTIEDRAKADARRRGFTIAVRGDDDTGEQTLQAELTEDVEARLKQITEDNKRRSMMQSITTVGGGWDTGGLHIQSDVMDSKDATKFIRRRNKEARKAMRRLHKHNTEKENDDDGGSGDIVIPPPKRTLNEDEDDLQDGEEDQELYRQLERQKLVEEKVVLKKGDDGDGGGYRIKARSLVKEEPLDDTNNNDGASSSSNIIDLDNGASYLHTHLIDEDKIKDETTMGDNDGGGSYDDDHPSGDGGGKLMSRASEFCASIQTAVELKKAQKDEEYGARKAYRESRRRMLKGATRNRGNTGDINDNKEDNVEEDRESDNIDDDMMSASYHNHDEEEEEEEEFNARNEAMKDDKVDDGAACAIKYFAERGMMSSGDQDSFNSYDPGKRPMTSGEDELRIDHRDEFGRVQSAKEAFRTMSWRFHGKGPHWKNVERRVNRIQNDVKRRQETSQVAPTLRALERVQKKEGNS
ncbi:hypothetical protein FOL47_009211 [Perkinsus chesapeaki]|uniref:U4/U6.U5 tri-snRNP-associated protein 1 n=1 Tax=Perkinsus chesapeaki TaxID=330153 RepID=A0A7J6L9P7_PERCH|nr:hypothetical protein FOL47_009211 [Perkinsus chesapeaki]